MDGDDIRRHSPATNASLSNLSIKQELPDANNMHPLGQSDLLPVSVLFLCLLKSFLFFFFLFNLIYLIIHPFFKLIIYFIIIIIINHLKIGILYRFFL
jgi:hypothetical protein